MNRRTAARLFWEALPQSNDDAFVFLSTFICPENSESEWLDYKKWKKEWKDDLPKRDKNEIKATWSEYIGAFANSSGGILIYGVDAPERDSPRIELCPTVSKWRDYLWDLRREVTEPVLSGVEIRAITKPGSEEGFIVAYIPLGMFQPYRSKSAPKEFYLRIGDSSLQMPMSVLRSLFTAQRACRFEFEVTSILSPPSNDANGQVDFSVRIELLSGPSAQNLRVKTICSTIKASGKNAAIGPFRYFLKEDIARQQGNDGKSVITDFNTVLHQGEKVCLFQNVTAPLGRGNHYAENTNVVFEFTVYGLDIPATKYICRIPWFELNETGSKCRSELFDYLDW